MAIVVVLAGSWLGYQRLADNGCTGQIKLAVAAATEIAPAIEQSAQTWMTNGANVNGTCVNVSVTGVNPATMAGAVARKHGVTLTGVGEAAAAVTVPDVWVADSSSWLLRLKSEASGFNPTDGKSIAQSPVVVAMPVPLAENFGWPDNKLGWKDLLARMQKDTKLRTGIVDPARDSAGLAGLLALAGAAGAGAEAQKAKVGALRALADGSSKLRDDLLQRFPRSADASGLADGISAAPLSEEDVVAFNAERPPVQLAALYLTPAPPALDYPYAVMPEVDLPKSAAATGLRQALEASAFKNALAGAGLRGSDGTAGAGFVAPVGAPEATAPATPSADPAKGGKAAAGIDAGTINGALGSWFAITLPGRVLAVFDISGSMLKDVPTAPGLNRAQVTQGAATQGLGLFNDKWSVGVWLFSTELNGKRPWKEIVPISPLATARGDLQDSIKQIIPKPGGATGLYDTALAAYKAVQADWQPGVVNSVILFTDGKNENKAGLKKDALVREMKKASDPTKPVRMVIIGIGDEVDPDELETITNATQAGGVFIAEDPTKISQIFLQAISSRSGAQR
jgi:hypothetical protein